ncbi:MAG TPA: hypothetical protein DDY32_10510 [Desulfobulbaceae bacterium]|nr:hypothetical protein [Desulfobulbaceae bacterium]
MEIHQFIQGKKSERIYNVFEGSPMVNIISVRNRGRSDSFSGVGIILIGSRPGQIKEDMHNGKGYWL